MSRATLLGRVEQLAGEALATASRALAVEAAELRRERGEAPSASQALARAERLATLHAQQSYVQRTRRLPEYAAAFFVGELARHLCAAHLGVGSRGAPPTPAWAEALTASSANATSPPPPLAVLVAINHLGVLLRPMPPRHAGGGGNGNGHGGGSGGSGGSGGNGGNGAGNGARITGGVPECFDAATGRAVPWQQHSVTLIEVWGVKKHRPTFTYRVRERALVNVEVSGPQFKEMAAHPRLNVIICTAPLSRFDFVLVEKFRWVEKHLGRE